MTDSIHKEKLYRLDKPATIGNNSLPTGAMFIQRKAYTKLVGEWYPHPYLLDFWYDRPFHSKVDRKCNSVYISETNLKQVFPLETTGFEKQSHFVADFVADAYHDFQFYIKNKLKDSGSTLHNVKPRIGWISANKLHHQWINATYKAFSTIYINEGNRSRRIKSFGTFMKVFYEFIGPTLGDTPFTKSGFIASKYYPKFGGGLMLETALENHADDLTKHLRYFRDPYFDLYKDIAKDFGFKLDKNAPWRLIADIESPRMQKYIIQYGVNEENLFNQYYYKSYIYDIETMKINLLAFYNSYITASPFYKILKSCPTGETAGGFPSFVTKQTIVSRKPITMAELNHQYGELYWLMLYFEIRMKEIKVSVSKAKFNDITNKVTKMNKMFDFPTALDYTNDIIRKNWAKRIFKDEKEAKAQSIAPEGSIPIGGGASGGGISY